MLLEAKNLSTPLHIRVLNLTFRGSGSNSYMTVSANWTSFLMDVLIINEIPTILGYIRAPDFLETTISIFLVSPGT